MGSGNTTAALGSGACLELGYWLSSEEHSAASLIANAVRCERSGFRTAMISDHFAPWIPVQGQSPFVWSTLGGIASATSGLRVGTGVTAPLHRMHPVMVAQAAATIETMMPGRFFLGLGTGENLNEHVTRKRWPTAPERRHALREGLDIIRALWAGETVSRSDGSFEVERAQLFTRPDTPPPVVIAASGKKTAKLAGELADGLLGLEPDPDIVDVFEAEGGQDCPRLAQLQVCWAPTESEARCVAHRWWPIAGLPPGLLTELARPEDFAAAAELVTEDDVAEHVTCGPDPDVHAAAIHRLVAAGFTTIYLHQVGPNQDGFLDFCQRELLPRFPASA
jgi:coenzyme F420-dependent glucose-6-phosphate dehydrogenase